MVRFRVVDECDAAMSNSLGGPCGAIWRTNKGVTKMIKQGAKQ